ncbi:MAG: branched-chain amino acid ABC transporter permease [Candidatus Bathyarchaeia archaeon]
MIDPNLVAAAILDGLAYSMLLFLIASGFSIIFGLMGILNFAHGAFFMIGAYIAVTFFELTNNFAVALICAAFFGFLIGVIVERLTLRRVHGNPIAQIMLTLGYLLLFSQLVLIIWGRTPKIFYLPYLSGSAYRTFLAFLGFMIAVFTYLLLTRTKMGIIVQAGTEDAEMVEALGINIKRVFTLTFGFGALLAAFGGASAVPWLGATPQMGSTWMFTSLVVTVVGGLGSFKGSFYGSLIIGMLHGLSEYFFPQLTFVIDFLAMAIVLLIRTEGLFGVGK